MKKPNDENFENLVECHWKGSVLYVNPRLFFSVLSMDATGARPYVRYETGAQMFDCSRGEFIKLAHDANAVHLHNSTAFVNSSEVCRYLEGLDSRRRIRAKTKTTE